MKPTLKLAGIAIALGSVLFAALFSSLALAADTPNAAAQVTFDGSIKNNSLALSPDERFRLWMPQLTRSKTNYRLQQDPRDLGDS